MITILSHKQHGWIVGVWKLKSSERCTAAGSAVLLIVEAASEQVPESTHIITLKRKPAAAPRHEFSAEVCFQIPTRAATSQIVFVK